MIKNILLAQTPTGGIQDIIMTGNPIVDPITKKPIENVSQIISAIMKVVYPLGGVILFFMIVWGGFDILTSEGNAEKVKSGRAKITSAIIGFVLLALSFLIVRVITYILGIDKEVI